MVHMKILEVLLECMRCSAGDQLSNEDICGMITECFNVRCRKGVSKLLMKYAENVLVQMVLVVFSRLRCCALQWLLACNRSAQRDFPACLLAQPCDERARQRAAR